MVFTKADLGRESCTYSSPRPSSHGKYKLQEIQLIRTKGFFLSIQDLKHTICKQQRKLFCLYLVFSLGNDKYITFLFALTCQTDRILDKDHSARKARLTWNGSVTLGVEKCARCLKILTSDSIMQTIVRKQYTLSVGRKVTVRIIRGCQYRCCMH